MIWNHPAICRDCLGRAHRDHRMALAITGSIGLSAARPNHPIADARHAQVWHLRTRAPAPATRRIRFRRFARRFGWAHQIELDVYLTKDKHLVIMHDSTVDRTTDGTGKIADLTLAEIKQLDAGGWKGPQYAGERVPTLEEVLAIMPDNVWLNLHLKGGAELGAAVARQVVRDQRTHQAFLAAGRSVIEAARKVCLRSLSATWIAVSPIRSTRARHAQGAMILIQLLGKLASPDDMAGLWRRESINYCCTNDPESLEKLYAAGVEFALVDDLEKMMQKAAEVGIRPLKPVFRAGGNATGQ